MIILVQGPPCSGKSTLSRRLSVEFGIEYMSKDDVCEALFAAGIEDPGRAPNEMLFNAMKRLSPGEHLIVETNLDPETAKVRLADLVQESDQIIFEFFITAPTPVLLERFVTRWESGQRHPGHRDDEKVADLETYLNADPQPVGFGEVVSLDGEESTDAVFEVARDAIRNALG